MLELMKFFFSLMLLYKGEMSLKKAVGRELKEMGKEKGVRVEMEI